MEMVVLVMVMVMVMYICIVFKQLHHQYLAVVKRYKGSIKLMSGINALHSSC